jgi:hypothetical protein
VRSILAKEGVRGLYAGYGAFLLRDLPFDAIEFVAYEQVGAARRGAARRGAARCGAARATAAAHGVPRGRGSA